MSCMGLLLAYVKLFGMASSDHAFGIEVKCVTHCQLNFFPHFKTGFLSTYTVHAYTWFKFKGRDVVKVDIGLWHASDIGLTYYQRIPGIRKYQKRLSEQQVAVLNIKCLWGITVIHSFSVLRIQGISPGAKTHR